MKKALIASGILACLGMAGFVWMGQHRAVYENPLFAQNPERTFEFAAAESQAFILPRDIVRVMLIENDAPASAEPKIILRDIRVLAIEQLANKTMRAVLDVDAAIAAQLREAQRKGRVWLAIQPIA